MKSKVFSSATLWLTAMLTLSCSMELQAPRSTCHEEMIKILRNVQGEVFEPTNMFNPEAKLPYMDSLLSLPHSTPGEIRYCNYLKANILMELGREGEAIKILERLTKDNSAYLTTAIRRSLAIAYLRQGERANCIANHAAESCIVPMKGLGIYADQRASNKAIDLYQEILATDQKNLEARWLLNLAHMTLGDYSELPDNIRIPGMQGDTTYKINAFEDIATDLKLDVNNMAGGSIADDFDNDGYLDLVTSSWGLGDKMHYFKNNADGTFTDLSGKAGLNGITGGLNIIQADYNNDGYKDIFVLRGAWKGEFGKEPNSLLRNNQNGTFTDVTTQAGLLSFHPTQTATWNDFNNDGWVDLFIGNETSLNKINESVFAVSGEEHPCELYINNRNGTFREIASQAKCDLLSYVKGVTSGDYDHDGWQDIFISTVAGERRMLKNMGVSGEEIVFEDVTIAAGFGDENGRTFPTWFWDYDNDGWLDVFACDYTFEKSLSHYAAAELLNIPTESPQTMLLYRNNHDGTFTNVSAQVGLDKKVFAMGSNFGDVDNDGFLDMYLGTGNPLYQSLVPNRMFLNQGGKRFVDVTASARVGHLQKGHAVSFADMDNDGDQDIHIELGGAYVGDAYQNSFFLNPGQGTNNWVCLALEGTTCNRSAIGTRVKVTFRENGVTRSVYRDVNSGGSFGASPLRREIGIGQASIIDEIEIRWAGSGKIQVLKNVDPNQFLKVTEGIEQPEKIKLKAIEWITPNRLCAPPVQVSFK